MENTQVDHIKAIGGRFVLITFPNSESRDNALKEEWWKIWLEELSPWKGEAAKDERFAWLLCFGMPLNGWSTSNFKLIGDAWGSFLQTDEATLHEKSYEKGRILIATEHIQKISGCIDFEILGIKYSVRVEEEDSFRSINSNFLTTVDPKDYVNCNKEPNPEIVEVDIAKEKTVNGDMNLWKILSMWQLNW